MGKTIGDLDITGRVRPDDAVNLPIWAAGKIYETKDLISHLGSIYTCSTPHTASASFATDSTMWKSYGVSNSDFASESAVSPATPGSPTVNEIKTWANNTKSNVMVWYNGTNIFTLGQTHVYHIDGANRVLQIWGPGAPTTINASGFDGNLGASDDTLQEVAQKFDDYVGPVRYHLKESVVNPDAAGSPTLAEITAAASAESVLGNILTYTGTEQAFNTVTHTYHVDKWGQVSVMHVPSAGGATLPTEHFFASTTHGGSTPDLAVAINTDISFGSILAVRYAGPFVAYNNVDQITLPKGVYELSAKFSVANSGDYVKYIWYDVNKILAASGYLGSAGHTTGSTYSAGAQEVVATTIVELPGPVTLSIRCLRSGTVDGQSLVSSAYVKVIQLA